MHIISDVGNQFHFLELVRLKMSVKIKYIVLDFFKMKLLQVIWSNQPIKKHCLSFMYMICGTHQ